MKELSRFEMAAVKRTAQNVKTMRRKLEKLEVQQAEITKEVNSLSELIYDWEQPIIKMTGGFTSEQVLNGEMNIQHEELPENSVVDDSSLAEYPLELTDDEYEELPEDGVLYRGKTGDDSFVEYLLKPSDDEVENTSPFEV